MLVVGGQRDLRRLLVADVRDERRHEHERALDMLADHPRIGLEPASAAKALRAGTNGWPVSRAISAAARPPNSGCAFSPVPTAVPPSASAYRPGSVARTPAVVSSSCATHPEII